MIKKKQPIKSTKSAKTIKTTKNKNAESAKPKKSVVSIKLRGKQTPKKKITEQQKKTIEIESENESDTDETLPQVSKSAINFTESSSDSDDEAPKANKPKSTKETSKMAEFQVLKNAQKQFNLQQQHQMQ